MRITLVLCLLAVSSWPAYAADQAVTFDPTPGAAWQCGLGNDDLPGLADERMLQPIAVGCARGEARAYAVIVDLSDSRSAMTAEQMAGDAEEQLPSSWKVDSKQYDILSLESGRSAAYSRLVGRGDGFTFLSGQTPMVAISVNVPMLFEDASGAARQTIAVFRVRSPLSGTAAQRKERIAELDRAVRAWAATARPESGKAITERDFEAAAYARTKGEPGRPSPAAPALSQPAPDTKARISAAIVAAANGRATAEDVAVLEDAERRFPNLAMAGLARSFVDDARRDARLSEQQQILTAAIEGANDRAVDVFSRFIAAAAANGDVGGIEAAVNVARSRQWKFGSLTPAARNALAAAVLKRTFVLPDSPDLRPFFEVPSLELLPLVHTIAPVPAIEQIARRDRDAWRLKTRDANPVAVLLVRDANGLGALERQADNRTYRHRPLTNLLDVAAGKP